MNDVSPAFEPRRYSAVLLSDDRFDTVSEICTALDIPSNRVAPIDSASVDWATFKVDFEHDKNLYPDSSVRSTASSTANGYLYDFYVALGPSINDGPATILLASPYMRLLARALETVAKKTPGGPPRYVKPDMDVVFRHFESHFYAQMSATRITVQVDADQGLDFVDLAGRNPLRSGLRQALEASQALPYAIRINGKYVDSRRGINIGADRHGNVFWHLANEASLVNVLALTSVFVKAGGLTTTTDAPWRRLSSEG